MDIDLNVTLVEDEYDSSDDDIKEESNMFDFIHIVKNLTVADNQSISSGSYYEDIDLLRRNDLSKRNGNTNNGSCVTRKDIQQILDSSDDDSGEYSELEVLFDNEESIDELDENLIPETSVTEDEKHKTLLLQVDFFSQFPKFIQDKLFLELVPKKYKKGDIIINEGDTGDGMYIIMHGVAQVWTNHQKRHVTNLYAKMYFGERALLYSNKRSANITASEDTTTLFLSKEAFRKIPEVRPYLLTKKIPIIQKLKKNAQIAVASKMVTKKFNKGENLMVKGAIGQAFYLIVAGSAGVMSAEGDVEVVIREGNIVGQKSVLNQQPRNATVTALEDLVCLELRKDALDKIDDFRDMMLEETRRTTKIRQERQKRRNSSMQLNKHSSMGIDLNLVNARKDSVRNSTLMSPVRKDRRLNIIQSNGKKRINDWYVEERLGKGSFGVVYRCQHVDSKEIATIKIINKTNFRKGIKGQGQKRGLDDLFREVHIMSGLFHQNIVRLLALIDDPKADDLVIIMEYCEKRGIFDSHDFEPLSEEVARRYFRDVLSGLDYLHHKGICHRDIKPMNLFVTSNDVVKIGDFGTACYFQEEKSYSLQKLVEVAGTPAFMAPEILVEENSSYHGPAVDLWSCGATLFMFVTGSPPWHSSDELELIRKVKYDELTFPRNWVSLNLSVSLTHLIRDLLKKRWEERLTLPQTMKNEWVTSEQSDPLPIIYSVQNEANGNNTFIFDETKRRRATLKAFTPRRPLRFSSKHSLLESAIKRHSQSFCVTSNNSTALLSPLNEVSGYHVRSKTTINDLEGSPDTISTKPSVHFSKYGRVDKSSGTNSFRSMKSRLTQSCLHINMNEIDLEYFDNFLEAIRYTPNRSLSFAEHDIEYITGQLTENSNDHLMSLYNRRSSFKSGSSGSSRYLHRGTIYDLSYSSLKHDISDRIYYQGSVVHESSLIYGYFLSLGTRPRQEDRASIVESFNIDSQDWFFAGIFDGFGGDLVSELVSRKLPYYLGRALLQHCAPSHALKTSIVTVNKRFLKKAAKSVLKDRTSNKEAYLMKSLIRTRKGTTSQIAKYQTAGSTAAMVLVETRSSESFLHIAWLGDSRVLLCRNGKCEMLTIDHKSASPKEEKRIRAAGGVVYRDRLNGNMLVSRGFGSLHVVGKALPDTIDQCKSVLKLLETDSSKLRHCRVMDGLDGDPLCNGPFCSIPGVKSMKIENDFEFLVIASDGLFEEASNEEVVKFTRANLKFTRDLNITAKELVKKYECSDNTSALVIKLNS